jgi:hypothetical protein
VKVALVEVVKICDIQYNKIISKVVI